MAEAVFPMTLPGIGFSVEKTPIFQTRIMRAASGREVRAEDYRYPLWRMVLVIEFLRDKASLGLNELNTLRNFYLATRGASVPFLLEDPDDSLATAQTAGVGDGVTTQFQLHHSYVAAGFSDRVTAPKVVSNVFVSGVDPGGWTVNAATGVVTMASPPAGAAVITATFSFYFRMRFVEDSMPFEKFMHKLWEVKQIAMISVPP